MEDSAPTDIFKDWINLHQDHTVISYIKCSVEEKAISDIICVIEPGVIHQMKIQNFDNTFILLPSIEGCA